MRASRSLWPHDAAIEIAVVAAGFKRYLIGVFRGRPFVDVDTPTGLVIAVHIAALDFRASREDFPRLFVKERLFLDAEIGRCQIQMHIVAMTDGIDIIGTMPGSAHS